MRSWRAAVIATACIVLLAIVLTVALTVVGLLRLSEYNKLFSTVRAPRCRVSDAYDLLKTGDLLLFVATTHSPTNSVITQTFYSHAGLLLREGDLVRVSEAQPGLELMPDPARPGADYRMPRGATVTPLLTRLKYYTGDYYLLRLSRPLDPPREDGLKRRAEQLSREEYPYPSAAQLALEFFGWKTASRHCFQHVAHLLDRAGLAPLDRGPLSEAGFAEVCGEICGISGRPLKNGRVYSDPIQLVYDIGTLQLAG